MILNFKDFGFYFILVSPLASKSFTVGFFDYDVGDFMNIFEDSREVAEYFLTFATDKMSPESYIDRYMEDLVKSNIQGVYSVPELNVKEVSFVDVLKAVKKYYIKKSSSQVKHKKAG